MQLLDFEKARKEVLAVLAGKVNTVIAIKVVEALKKATIEAEPVRHGRWEECDWLEYDGHSECVRYPKKGRVCTNCRNAFKKEFIDNPRVHYCPNCGCKMDGDNHGNVEM